MMQYDLFGQIEETTEVGKTSWSHSKRSMLKQCPRKFYYQYYGANKKHALNQPLKETLIFSKTVGNKFLLQGDVVHVVIASYFNKVKNIGIEPSYEQCVAMADELIQNSVNYSNSIKNGNKENAEPEHALLEEKREHKPTLLKEIYTSDISISELIQESQEKVHKNLKNFYVSEKFAHLKYGGKRPSSLVEGKSNFEIEGYIKVSGKIDVSYQEPSQFIIADWKTGKNADEDTSLQLLAYALWAIQEKGATPAEIKIQKAYLLEDRLDELEFSDKHLMRARSRIIQDAQLMQQMHQFGKNGIYDAFDKCNQPKVCAHCPFEEVCIKN